MILEKSIQANQKHEEAIAHKNRLAKINVSTQWYNQSLKVNKINENRMRSKLTQDEIKYAQQELKIRRNTRLKILYEKDAEMWENMLAQKGLAIIKDRN